ncbi:hypothetical protein [Brevibacillus choshinensis]|uniref:DUF1643 domain-containing protein n=1 Tax=Brevibacillus choshinensis TaxID=54911 RepID=A0ABX7FK34_BRECH|nr:hypothetical protein [Brevibacillus choshinensis]QRG65999.1 hypothetical protein JNE38_20795 [Brevibacillus choshinensis]
MNQPKAFGAFVKRGDHTFRTSAYIQWGESEKSIGSCLLLNPGSADFNKINPDLREKLNTTNKANGEIKTDPTMGQLIKLVDGINSSNQVIEGRFHIYNLFSLQDASANSAICKFETLVKNKEYDLNESLVSINELQVQPWILLGWSLKRHGNWGNLNEIKKRWKMQIAESKIPSFGKQDRISKDYYHPNPRNPTHKPIILKELIDLYAKI